MNGSRDTRASGQERDAQPAGVDVSRREYLSVVAGLAATQWDADGVDPDDLAQWDDGAARQGYRFDEFDVVDLIASADGRIGGFSLSETDWDRTTLSIEYDPDGVSLSVDADAADVRGGFLAKLDPVAAREIAVDLFRAGVEAEARHGAGAPVLDEHTDRADR
jgi:hypothetical protein